MATKLTCRADIPAVLAELTAEEKLRLLGAVSSMDISFPASSCSSRRAEQTPSRSRISVRTWPLRVLSRLKVSTAALARSRTVKATESPVISTFSRPFSVIA